MSTMNPGMYSSSSPEWATPQWLFDGLNEEFGPFDLDPCATPENAKCPRFFTKEQDGLLYDWEGKVFMNPPYGRRIGLWVRKACDEGTMYLDCTVVCLLPARTDTRWFHDYCLPFGQIRFLRGRLKFGGSKNSAPFGSMVVVFSCRQEP